MQVDSAVKNVLSQIRNSQVGGGQYGEGVFTFVATETSVSAVPLVDYVTKTINNYTEERCRHLFFNIFKAFETLHQRNVVHRSIRREHIYVQVSPFDREGRCVYFSERLLTGAFVICYRKILPETFG